MKRVQIRTRKVSVSRYFLCSDSLSKCIEYRLKFYLHNQVFPMNAGLPSVFTENFLYFLCPLLIFSLIVFLLMTFNIFRPTDRDSLSRISNDYQVND